MIPTSVTLFRKSVPPLVTAVITTCARPQYVHTALASVFAETYPNVEIVVVDDGGSFEVTDRRVTVLRCDMGGVGRARNAGLDAARGEYVIFLDDDDVALPHRIATLVDAAERHRADLCFGMTRRVITGSSAELPDVPTHVLSHGAQSFGDILSCNPHVNAVLARTSTLRAAGGFDAGAAHFDDWSAWLRLADRGATICSVDEVVAEWRIHNAGLSSQVIHLRAMKERVLALFDRLSGELTADGTRELAIVRRIVARNEINTYDDYANVMQAAYEKGRPFGRPSIELIEPVLTSSRSSSRS
ncbi:MAG TPA: glycosyltransferase family 2 protein [Thermoanaerobaculia bacterium]